MELPTVTNSLTARWRRPLRGIACMALMVSLGNLPTIAFAGEWTANFTSLVGTTYNDNPSLVTTNASARTDFTVNRAVDAEYAKERYKISILGRVEGVMSKAELTRRILSPDQVRYNLDVGGQYDFNTSVISAAFGSGFDTVQNTEFADTGILTTGATRTDRRLNLTYNQNLSERWSLNATDDYSIASYSGGNFTGYSNNDVLIGFSNTYSEKLILTPSVGYTRYSPDSTGLSVSNTYRLQMGAQYDLSDTDSISGSLGAVRTDGNLGWSALLDYSQEVLDGLTATANVNRDNIASSAGNVRQSAGFGGGVNYQLSEAMQLGLAANWRRSSQVGATGAGTTTQFTIDPTVNWTISEAWRADLNFQNRHQKLTSTGTATSNSVTLSLNYNSPLE